MFNSADLNQNHRNYNYVNVIIMGKEKNNIKTSIVTVSSDTRYYRGLFLINKDLFIKRTSPL